MQKLSERSLQLEKRSLDAEDIQVTCTPTSLRSTSGREDSMVVRARSPRCLFSPCPETTLHIRSQTSPATSLRARSTKIEDCIEKKSILPSTRHHPSLD